MEDQLRPVVGTDGSDDCVHVDAKPGEVHHGLHSTNANNCGLSLGLVRISIIMMFSDVALTLLKTSHSTRTLFL